MIGVRIMAVVFAVIFVAGCVQSRDYVGAREGALGLKVKRGFGVGDEPKKDYYVIQDGDGIVVGDTKNDLIRKMGLPDEVKTTLEGYESWTYSERGVTFYFSEEHITRWDEQ